MTRELDIEVQFDALDESESRYEALVRNTPGLVFDFRLNARGDMVFGFLSNGCQALLGMEPAVLKQSPEKFFTMMNPDDLQVLRASIKASRNHLKPLNWEGRVWIEAWQDTKWLNVRATPRLLQTGKVEWQGIMTNITQSKNEKRELEESRRRLSELSAHLTKVKEEERQRIAREIHDDLGGNLTAIKIGLGSLLNKLAENPQLIEKVKNLELIVDGTFEAAHRISADLRPTVLELGIVAALEWQAKEFTRQMDIACNFTTNQHEVIETPEQAITLYRICQEAMSNTAKYARAKRLDVALLFNKHEISMYITDDGVGINPEDALKPNSFGLRGMHERVTALSGSFSVSRAEQGGTHIAVVLPIKSSRKAS